MAANQTTTPQPNNASSVATPAPQVLNGVDQYTPPAGLSATKTAGGGTGYSDAQGNIYVQSSPGRYTLTPATSNPVAPIAPATSPQANPAPATGSSPSLATPPQQTGQSSTTPQPTKQSQGQYYYTKSQDASGKSIVTYYDSNGSILPTNPIGGDNYASNPEQTPGGGLIQLPSPPTQGVPPGTQQSSSDALNNNLISNTNDYTAKLDALNAQTDSAFSEYESQLAKIQNGTFPLTPSQSAILSTTQQQFDQLRAAQIIANETYTQGMRVFEARSGEGSGGVTTAMGNVQNTINLGISKLNALDSQAAQTLAQLQQGFQSDNLKMITTAYDAWNSYATKKENALKEIADSTSKAIIDLRDFTYKQAQDQVSNIFKANTQQLDQAKFQQDKDKFTWQQKQDQLKNILDNKQFNEKQMVDLKTLAQKQEALDLQKAANDMIQGAYSNSRLSGVPQTLPDGSPNPKYQDTFLSTLSPAMQTTIKGIADYSMSPTMLTTSARQALGGLTQSQAIAMAKQYDPTYSEGEYAIRNTFMKNWQTGGQNSVIQAANTSIDHLTKLYTESQNLGNIPSGSLGPFTTQYNTVTQWLNEGSQNKALSRFKQDAVALAGEQARIYKNGSGSNAAPGEDEIKQQLAILTANLSPDNAKSLIENGINLFTDRLTSATENYNSVMGKPPSSILYPTALDNINTLKSEGFNIDTSKLNPSPYSSMSSDQFLSSISGNSSGTPQSTADFFGSMLQNANSASQL